MPPILVENEDAERIYLVVQDQVIAGMGGPIALNQMAIHEAMELYGVADRLDCFEKVVACGRYFIAKHNEQAKERMGK